MPLASRPGFPFRDDDDPSREPTGSERGVTSRGFFRLASDGLCWLGGARPATLRYCPSEAGRFVGLGLAVLLTGCFGGAAATFATSFFLHKSVGRLWPVGLVWGIAIANIDRLLIMMAGTRRRLAITIPLRLLLAVPIGLLIAEIILLQIFQPEENGIINDRQQTQATQQIASIEAVYQPKITGDQTAITQLQQQIAGQAAQIEQNQFLSGCESSDVRCSTTQHLGCDVYCQHYARLATTEQAQLDADRPGIEQQIQAKQQDATRLDAERLAAEAQARARLAAANGLGAHKEALDQLQKQDGGVRQIVWLLRISLILLDLMPVLLKSFFVMLGTTLHDETAAALGALESVNAHWLRKLAWFRKNRIDRQLEAQDEVDEAQVDAEKERLIAAAEGRPAQPAGRPTSSRQPPIPALSLSQFTGRARRHEGMATPIEVPLTRAAWIGTALLAALAAALLIAADVGHFAVTGAWIAFVGLALALGLAVYTHGFRRAPAWAQRGAFGIALAGLLLPPLIVLANV